MHTSWTPARAPGAMGPDLGAPSRPAREAGAPPAWTAGLAALVRTAENDRSSALNALVHAGVVPGDEEGVRDLVEECLRCGEQDLLALILPNLCQPTLWLHGAQLSHHALDALRHAMPLDMRAGELKISNGAPRGPEIRQLGLIMNRMPNLAKVALMDLTLTSHKIQSLTDTLKSQTRLTSLNFCRINEADLKHNRPYFFENQVRGGEKVSKLICGALKGKRHLDEFRMTSNLLKARDHQDIAKALASGGFPLSIMALEACGTLHLRDAASAYRDAFKHLGALQVLDLGGSRLEIPACNALLSGLADNKTLHTLSLRNCDIWDSSQGPSFEQRIKLDGWLEHGNVRVLDLGGNVIGSRTLVPILEALDKSSRLERLDLSGICVDDEWFTPLLKLISTRPTLSSLCLSMLDTKQLSDLDDAMADNTGLRVLSFRVPAEGLALGRRIQEHVARSRREWMRPFVEGAMTSVFGRDPQRFVDADVIRHMASDLLDPPDPTAANIGLVDRAAYAAARAASMAG